MDQVNLIQWPTRVVTLLAAWLVAAKQSSQRNVGFWLFLLSNTLWIIWGASTGAYALIVLQIGLAAMNIRGARKVGSTTDSA
ncbi:MAG: hypothetical protein KDI32_13455 [Pseudomonadales bacterium]|nr:hypothetical protein [Pseudomonadales bacterium]